MCLHAPPASLYLSLFSLLGVDIRRPGEEKKKAELHDKFEKGHKFLYISTAYWTKEWGGSFFHRVSGEELEASAT